MIESFTAYAPDAIALMSEAVDWLKLRWNDILRMPEISAALVLPALLTGALSRRVSLLLGSLLLSLIALSSLVIQSPELVYLSIACQVFMVLSAIGNRRHTQRLKRAAEKLRDEKERLQELLDRETLWRLASESTVQEYEGTVAS